MSWGWIARLLFTAGLAIALEHSAGQAAGKIRVAQTSVVTNSMMSCNSQAATCQTTCLIPGALPTGAATTGSNANQSTPVSSIAQLNKLVARRIAPVRRRPRSVAGRIKTDQLKSTIDSVIESMAFSVAARPTAIDSAA